MKQLWKKIHILQVISQIQCVCLFHNRGKWKSRSLQESHMVPHEHFLGLWNLGVGAAPIGAVGGNRPPAAVGPHGRASTVLCAAGCPCPCEGWGHLTSAPLPPPALCPTLRFLCEYFWCFWCFSVCGMLISDLIWAFFSRVCWHIMLCLWFQWLIAILLEACVFSFLEKQTLFLSMYSSLNFLCVSSFRPSVPS